MIVTYIARGLLLLLLSFSLTMAYRCHGKIQRAPFNGFFAAGLAVVEGLLIWLAGGFS